MLYLNTYDLLAGQFTGRFVQYRNTILESIYGIEFLTGHEDQGDKRQYSDPTPLFVVDCSTAIKWHNAATNEITREMGGLKRSKDVELYLQSTSDVDRQRLAEIAKPETPLLKYLDCEVRLSVLGTQNDYIQRKLEEMESKGVGKVVFASSSRKDGKVFAYANPEQWNDLLGAKAISHGNNLVSGNRTHPTTLKDINVILVDDDDTESMALYRLGDCHGIVNETLAGPSVRGNPFQYRAHAKEERWTFKGVVRPGRTPKGIDFILPLSSFKIDKTLSAPLKPGLYKLSQLHFAVHKPAKSSWSSFGLACQYFKTQPAIDTLLSMVRHEVQQLQSLVVNGRFDLKSIAPLLFKDLAKAEDDENPSEEGTEADLTQYTALYHIITKDEYGLLADHPVIIRLISRWFANRIRDIAIRGGIRQRYLLACPCDALDNLEHNLPVVIIDDEGFTDTKGLVSRYPLRNRNDIQPFTVINLADVRLQLKNDTGGALPGDPSSNNFWLLLDEYLDILEFTDNDRDIIINEVRRLNLRYYRNTMWIGSKAWATYGGDFDGDYGNILPYSTAPALYDEALTWVRLPDTIKPPKNPLVGTIEKLAAKAMSNEISLLSWCSTIYNCFAEAVDKKTPGRSDALLAEISQQMQLAVDSFKSEHSVDVERMDTWAEECTSLTKRKYNGKTHLHWIRAYKSPLIYADSEHLMPTDLGDDTITKMSKLVNELFVDLDIKASPLDAFKDLIVAHPKALSTYGKGIHEFISTYSSELKQLLSKYFDQNGEPRQTTEVNGKEVFLGTDDFIQFRELKMELLERYENTWNGYIDACTNDDSKHQLEAVLWNMSHSKHVKGNATLAFYLLKDRIIAELQRPRAVSMELVNDSDKFRDYVLADPKRTYVGIFTYDPSAKGNATALMLKLRDDAPAKHVGNIYPTASAKQSKDQVTSEYDTELKIRRTISKSNVMLMRYDVLQIKGELPVQVRFLREYGSTYRYEVTTVINQSKATVQVDNAKTVESTPVAKV